MKKIAFVCAVTLVSTLFAADPNPFADYGKAMASDKDSPMAVEWQGARAEAIAAATEPSILAAFVEDAESAAALLDKLQPAYATCPMVMTQIAAVTQWVMLPEPCFLFFWEPSPAAGRKVWVSALEMKIATSPDDYIRTFCRQQLALCQ